MTETLSKKFHLIFLTGVLLVIMIGIALFYRSTQGPKKLPQISSDQTMLSTRSIRVKQDPHSPSIAAQNKSTLTTSENHSAHQSDFPGSYLFFSNTEQPDPKFLLLSACGMISRDAIKIGNLTTEEEDLLSEMITSAYKEASDQFASRVIATGSHHDETGSTFSFHAPANEAVGLDIKMRLAGNIIGLLGAERAHLFSQSIDTRKFAGDFGKYNSDLKFTFPINKPVQLPPHKHPSELVGMTFESYGPGLEYEISDPTTKKLIYSGGCTLDVMPRYWGDAFIID